MKIINKLFKKIIGDLIKKELKSQNKMIKKEIINEVNLKVSEEVESLKKEVKSLKSTIEWFELNMESKYTPDKILDEVQRFLQNHKHDRRYFTKEEILKMIK